MNILIDTLCCGNQMYGASRMLLEHLKRMTGPAFSHLKIHLIVSDDNAGLFDVSGVNLIFFPFSLRRRGISFPLQMLWERFSLPRLVRRLGIDVFLRPNLAWLHPLPCPQAAFILDLAEFHPQGGMQYSRLRRVYRRLAGARIARSADRVLTISEHAAQELRARFPDAAGKIEVVACGSPDAEPRRPAELREGDCLLTVGKLLLHKNHMTLCRAYVAADKARRLKAPLIFLGGDGNASQSLKDYVGSEGYADRIRFLGYVTEAEKKDIYRRAKAFLFPTFYEGFGLPILESMAQGLPVVSSNGASLPEVAGEAALLLDPGSVPAWAKAMDDIDADRIDLNAMALAGYANLKRFSWDGSAAKLAGILESLASGKSMSRPAPGRRAPGAGEFVPKENR